MSSAEPLIAAACRKYKILLNENVKSFFTTFTEKYQQKISSFKVVEGENNLQV
jgi:hypothetical protein